MTTMPTADMTMMRDVYRAWAALDEALDYSASLMRRMDRAIEHRNGAHASRVQREIDKTNAEIVVLRDEYSAMTKALLPQLIDHERVAANDYRSAYADRDPWLSYYAEIWARHAIVLLLVLPYDHARTEWLLRNVERLSDDVHASALQWLTARSVDRE